MVVRVCVSKFATRKLANGGFRLAYLGKVRYNRCRNAYTSQYLCLTEVFSYLKEEQMLLNTNDTAEFVELSRNFHQWYGANPEKTIFEAGLLNGDILIPVTVETLARLYDERLLTPDGKSKKVVTPDELAFCERLKVIGDAHKTELLQAQEIIMSRKEK